VREEQRPERLQELGHLVVELLPDAPREERDALQQPLDVRIDATVGQHRRQRGVRLRELATQLA
jgi:hypothetical protein